MTSRRRHLQEFLQLRPLPQLRQIGRVRHLLGAGGTASHKILPCLHFTDGETGQRGRVFAPKNRL